MELDAVAPVADFRLGGERVIKPVDRRKFSRLVGHAGIQRFTGAHDAIIFQEVDRPLVAGHNLLNADGQVIIIFLKITDVQVLFNLRDVRLVLIKGGVVHQIGLGAVQSHHRVLIVNPPIRNAAGNRGSFHTFKETDSNLLRLIRVCHKVGTPLVALPLRRFAILQLQGQQHILRPCRCIQHRLVLHAEVRIPQRQLARQRWIGDFLHIEAVQAGNVIGTLVSCTIPRLPVIF